MERTDQPQVRHTNGKHKIHDHIPTGRVLQEIKADFQTSASPHGSLWNLLLDVLTGTVTRVAAELLSTPHNIQVLRNRQNNVNNNNNNNNEDLWNTPSFILSRSGAQGALQKKTYTRAHAHD